MKNISPTLGVTPSPTAIYEGQSVSFNAAFSDPGFDNPLNTLDPANGGELTESFRYYLSWGYGLGTIATQDVAAINGGPGVASTRAFGGGHTYANHGAYTVTVRLADDDMGAYSNAALILTDVRDSDFVERTFTVAVSAIPEPSAIMLTMIGLACLLAPRRCECCKGRSVFSRKIQKWSCQPRNWTIVDDRGSMADLGGQRFKTSAQRR